MILEVSEFLNNVNSRASRVLGTLLSFKINALLPNIRNG